MKITVLHAEPPRFFNEEPEDGGPLRRSMFVEAAILELSDDVPDREVLEVVYAHTQNIDEAWNPEAPCRSTSMGDVLLKPNAQGELEAFEVRGIGFQKVAFSMRE